MRELSFACLCLFVIVSLAGTENASPPLPPDGFSPGWKRSEPERTFIETDLFNHIDGGAELFLEFGFARLSVQKYAKGASEMTLERYEMTSPSAALAIYLQRKGREKSVEGVVAIRHSGDAYQLTALKGRYFLQVNHASGQASELPVMAALVNQTAAQLPDEKEATALALLPPGQMQGSEQLIRGPYSLQNLFTFGPEDILSLARGRLWAAAADYPAGARGAQPFTRIIVQYPDRAAAVAAFGHLVSNLDPYLTTLSKSDSRLVFRDYQQKYGIVELREDNNNLLDIRIRLDSAP